MHTPTTQLPGAGQLYNDPAGQRVYNQVFSQKQIPGIPALVAGTNIVITGIWPNQTITAAHNPLINWTYDRDITYASYSASSNTGSNFIVNEYVGYTGPSGNITFTVSGSDPGALVLATGTNSGGYCRLFWRGGPNLNLTAGAMRLDASVLIPTASNATDRFSINIGFFDVISGAFNQRVVAQYVDNVNFGSWQLLWLNGGVPVNKTNTTNSPIFGSRFIFSVVINSAGNQAEFFQNGVSLGTVAIAPNIPLGYGLLINKSAGTTSRSASLYALTGFQTYNTSL